MLDTLLDAFTDVVGCDRRELAALVGSVRQPAEPSAERLVRRIAAHERLADAAQAAQAYDLAAAFRETREATDRAESCDRGLVRRTAGAEVAATLAVATMTAQCRLHSAGRAVHDHPQLLALVGTGRLSMAALRRVLEATDVLDAAERRRVDHELAADVTHTRLTPAQVGKAAERRVLAADSQAAAKRAAAARPTRSVRMGDPRDGVAGVYATVRAEEAWAVHEVLDRTARAMRQHGDPRDLDTLRADLFVEWMTGNEAAPPAASAPSHWRSRDGWEPWVGPEPPAFEPEPDACDPAWDALPTDALPTDDLLTDDLAEQVPRCQQPASPVAGPARALPRPLMADVEVQVVISAATLLGLDDQPGLLRGYGAVPAAVVRDIVDGADSNGSRTALRALFADPVDGRLLAMGSNARFFTGGLRQFVVTRDQSCRVAGGRIVDVDHIVDFQDGGPTTAANAQSLGKLAHVLKDHPRVSVTALPPLVIGDGLDHLRVHAPDVGWTLPTGCCRIHAPPGVLGPGSQPPDSFLEQQLSAWLAAAG